MLLLANANMRYARATTLICTGMADRIHASKSQIAGERQKVCGVE